MRIFAIILSLLCVSSLHSEETTDNYYKIYYISSSQGDDSNDGLSMDNPRKTICSITDKDHICIKLKKGDIFFENFENYSYCTVEPYGNGTNPVLCGFKILKNSKAWKYDEQNDYWMIDLQQEDNFVGFLSTKHGKQSTINNIGCIYFPSTDEIYGHNVHDIKLLNSDGDFFTNSSWKSSELVQSPFRFLYLKTKKNLMMEENVCVSTWTHCFYHCDNMHISNISVIGYAGHGFVNGSNCILDNCQFDIIGGAIQIDYQRWIRYGNGVEFWIHNSHNTVRNCSFSRTYDCATTIQGTTDSIVVVRDIHFYNNKMYHCRQAFEHFIIEMGNKTGSRYENCSFENNIAYEMGINEFDSPEARDANILSYENYPKDITIKNNLFWGSAYMCGKVLSSGIDNNKVYIYKGQYLNHYHGTTNKPTIYANTEEDIDIYKKSECDNSNIKIIQRGGIKDFILSTINSIGII